MERLSEIDLDRRRLLQLAAGSALGIGAVGVPLGLESRAYGAGGLRPVTMAMHIHSSFSESYGSMHSHLHQANKHGVDVIWWTDHDFRATAQGFRTHVAMTSAHEPAEHSQTWSWIPRSTESARAKSHSFGPRGMTVSASGTGGYRLEGHAFDVTYSTTFYDTQLVIDVTTNDVDAANQAVVRIDSSYHPGTGGRPPGQYAIEYRFGGSSNGYHTEQHGLLGVRTIASGNGHRGTYTLSPSSDQEHEWWPDLVMGDMSLWRIAFGVRAKGGHASATFKNLHFKRGRTANPMDGVAKQAAMIKTYRRKYTRVTQFQASEISLVRHVNAFGGSGVIPHYKQAPRIDTSVAAKVAMVRWLRHRGAVVAINHPLAGGLTPAQLVHQIMSTGGYGGANLIEIGCGEVLSHLTWAFDVLARNAVFMTATGTTDDHRGVNWLNSGTRWLTGVWAASKSKGDLLTALKNGRAWIVDPLHWRGSLDLAVMSRAKMGQAMWAEHRRMYVQMFASDLPAGSVVRLIVGAADRPGRSSVHPSISSVHDVGASHFKRGEWAGHFDVGAHGSYIRASIKTADGDVCGLSNPVWVFPSRLKDKIRIPHGRMAL
jgi:predicted metal-dependent phosphoesterase TrpH